MKQVSRTILATLLTVTIPLCWSDTAQAETYAERMTRGKLQLDLGNYQAAQDDFAAVAEAQSAPAPLRGEALVRLGLARRGLGDDAGSVAAFRKVIADHADDREALWLLVQATGSPVPSRERWDEVWREVRYEVDKKDPAHTRVAVVWPLRDRPETRNASLPSPTPKIWEHESNPALGAGPGKPGEFNRITLDFKDGDLGDIFRLFADITGMNVVVHPGIHGVVTLRLKDTPWNEVLEQILAVYGYAYRVEGNVLRIGTPAELGVPRTYSGKYIDIDFKEETLESAFGRLAQFGGFTSELGPGVSGRVTLLLKGVQWDQAFDIVARVNHLSWTQEGKVLRVVQQ